MVAEDDLAAVHTAPTPTPAEAVRMRANAKRQQVLADVMAEEQGDCAPARWDRREALEMHGVADHALNPAYHGAPHMTPGNGGELVPETRENRAKRPWTIDTVKQRPDMLTADASVQRLDLTSEMGITTMAVDAAQSIQARDSLERMLAHQMATAHAMAMKLAAKADHFLGHVHSWDSEARQQVQSIEAARMATASARMMDAYTRGLLALERLRNGGRQTVVVQHVHVADGGQAMVAGAVGRGAPGPDGEGTE